MWKSGKTSTIEDVSFGRIERTGVFIVGDALPNDEGSRVRIKLLTKDGDSDFRVAGKSIK